MKTFALATAAIGLAITATPALAGPADDNSMQISVEDINLDTPSGQKRLDRRIDRAAREVCGVAKVRTGTRIRDRSAQVCYEKSLASAKRQMAAIIEDQRRGG